MNKGMGGGLDYIYWGEDQKSLIFTHRLRNKGSMDALVPLGGFANLEPWARADAWAALTHVDTNRTQQTKQINKAQGRQEKMAELWFGIEVGC